MARKPSRGSDKVRVSIKAPAKRASKSTTPSEDTLAALSPARLAALILDEVAQNPAFKKRVSAAIAGLQGPDAVAALIDRRLGALEKARGFIDWQKRKSFAADLKATVATIVTDLKPLDPGMALDRLVRFLAGAEGTLERVDDSSGQVHAVYEAAAEAAAGIVASLPPEQASQVAETLVRMLDRDGFGLIDGLIGDLLPGLAADALDTLDARLVEALAAIPEPAPAARKPGFYGVDPAFEARLARMRLTRLRQAIADARGDVDAFIALETGGSPERQDSTAIAERLLAAGRAQEALDWIRRPGRRGAVVTREQMIAGRFDTGAPDWHREGIEIRILDALGQRGDAQAMRWSRFERSLDPQALRDYLAKLPDFEDEEALERAFALACAKEDPHGALFFLVEWPHLDRAARLVLDRRAAWRGQHWQWLAPAAEALEHDHPLAASLLYRALLDDILGRARSPAYGHGARHLARLGDLATRLEPGSLSPDHEAYRATLRKAHGRKAAFWSHVDE